MRFEMTSYKSSVYISIEGAWFTYEKVLQSDRVGVVVVVGDGTAFYSQQSHLREQSQHLPSCNPAMPLHAGQHEIENVPADIICAASAIGHPVPGKG